MSNKIKESLLEAKTSIEKQESKGVREHLSGLINGVLHHDSDSGNFVGYTGQAHKTLHNQLLKSGYSHDPDIDHDFSKDDYHKTTKSGYHTVTIEPMGSNLSHVTVQHYGFHRLEENLDSTRINLMGRTATFIGTSSRIATGEKLLVIGTHPGGSYQVKKKNSRKSFYVSPKELKIYEGEIEEEVYPTTQLDTVGDMEDNKPKTGKTVKAVSHYMRIQRKLKQAGKV